MDIKNKQKDIKDIIKLSEELGHEPTAKELDACPYTLSARQIQRKWGGLPALREASGFKIKDHTKGQTRSQTALASHIKASKYEKDLYQKVHQKYHDVSGKTTYVIREFAYQQYIQEGDYYKNIKCDVAIDDRVQKHVTMIDFFFAKDKHSLVGCINIKQKKLKKYPPKLFNATYEVVLVSVNPQIPAGDLSYSKERSNYTILTYQEFVSRFLDTPNNV